MIIEFSIGNYRSFNEVQTLSFRATGLVSEKENKSVDDNNIVEVNGQKLLKTVGVYGANASGKSNLLKGLNFLKRMVQLSLEKENLLSNLHEPFIKHSEPQNDAGFFQIVLLIDKKRYRYGFTLASYNISSEWLYGPAEKNETWYFKRKFQDIEINEEYFSEGSETPYESHLRDNTLFLSFCSSYNGTVSKIIRNFIAHNILIDSWDVVNSLTNSLINEGKKDIVLHLLNDAGLIFTDIVLRDDIRDLGNNTVYIPHQQIVNLFKNRYNDKGAIVDNIRMDLNQHESEGTIKYYSYVGILYHLFENGGVFVSDEIDSNFHPALLRKIIGMFNNPAINKANAQLLFTSHDTNLMSPDIMRRDQFYFTEKSPTDATVLYSLADLKGIRNNADFAKQYLAGYYGALPMLGNYLEEQTNPE